MKILELRFKNLNSLYGEWRVDFTNPDYTSNGLFVLTGSTGSGKSTLLDAICLALYGSTPRLGKITKKDNGIMSRRTGECYAEVLFESQAGRFRCHWEQHRARKKSHGTLADARHEISDAITGKPIETKKSRVLDVIKEKIGMGFDRFTRSVLLAQGGFDSFLKADAEEKSELLEQITGTEIYTEISKRVHDRKRREDEALSVLLTETSGIALLEVAEERQIDQERKTRQEREKTLVAKVTKTENAIRRLVGIATLEKELDALSLDSAALDMERDAFEPTRKRLERAMNAAGLDGDYATLATMRSRQKADREALRTEENKRPDRQDLYERHADDLKMTEQRTLNAKEEFKRAAPLIRRIRSLDQTIAEQKKNGVNVRRDCENDEEKINADNQRKGEELEKRHLAKHALERAEAYFGEHARDEWLVGNFSGIEEQLAHLPAKQKEVVQKTNDKHDADHALKRSIEKQTAAAGKSEKLKQALAGAETILKTGKNDLSEMLEHRLLREYRAEKDTLLREMVFLAKIAELSEHRAKLEDGKPCPLCGANDHPFARGNVPVPDETEKKIARLSERIRNAEHREADIKIFESAVLDARKNLAENETLNANNAGEMRIAEKNHLDQIEKVEVSKAEFVELKKTVLAKLRPLGVVEIPDANVAFLLESLTNRLDDWHRQVKKKTDGEKQIATLDGELKRLDAVIETKRRALTEKQDALNEIRKNYAAKNTERRALFGDKKTDTEETRLNEMIANAETIESQMRNRLSTTLQALNDTIKTVSVLTRRIETGEAELKTPELHFTQALQAIGFVDEHEFLDARLSSLERNRLKGIAVSIDERQKDVKVRQTDRTERLTAEKNRGSTDATSEELTLHSDELQERLRQCRTEIAGLQYRLTENIKAKQRVKEKLTGIDMQKKECRRWDTLHDLIGSEKGKKYRNFAQGLTFESMLSHANRRLEKMTDRYLLIRDETQPLELNVVDDYQAGEIRSTKNLSGGESFIVSLALALGLSKMAGRKVRVDSLFLDEGFGTLDEDALETALDTLSGLRQDGKLIGIISHVSALKERIDTQITVTPASGGKSTLSGPGCHQIL